jgi:mono/diheme cytochrome c family protein
MRSLPARTLAAVVAVLAVGVALFLFWAWKPALAPVALAQRSSFDAALLRKGGELAVIGNCNACHTKQEGQPYAGGRPIATPFGIVFSTNITPDPETGIGGWSEAAFARAMRDGVSRDGHHLYPAFPYDHMAKATDGDIRSVYAFILTREPANARAPSNDLPFPLNVRLLIAGWKLLFLDREAFQPDPSRSAEWNRGADLVEGLAHCGACHTPRNLLGAEKRDQPYAGGTSDGWIAPALNASSPAAVPWTEDRLDAYLRDSDRVHGVAAGPMADVVRNLARVPDSEVRAISVYVASMAGAPSRDRQESAERAVARAQGKATSTLSAAGAEGPGAALYAGACAQCHGEAGRHPALPAVNLTLSSALRTAEPDNAIKIVREGIRSPHGPSEPLMPGFRNILTDEQIIALLGYLRAHFTELPAWTGIGEAVRRAKQSDSAMRTNQEAETKG